MSQSYNAIEVLKRLTSQLEATLQYRGVVFSCIITFCCANVTAFFATAVPAWRATEAFTAIYRVSSAAARGSAATIDLNAGIIIIVACRHFLTILRNTTLNLVLPFDKVMPAFHTLVGNMLCIGALIHVIGHAIRYSLKEQKWEGFLGAISLAISGGILSLVLLSMRYTSFKCVRQRSFELFYYVHQCGFVIFFVLIMMHGSHMQTLKTWMYVVGPLCLYISDRVFRRIRQRSALVEIGRSSVNVKSAAIVCLQLPRLFNYRAGQYCQLCVPVISTRQWHPFTICSSPHEKEMRFYIKADGDWTSELHALFGEQDEDQKIRVNVRGPFGAPAEHVGQYEHVVLISGGVGATPMASIAKYASHWMLNYTDRGNRASASMAAAFSRNQVAQQRTQDMSRPPSRNTSSIPVTAERVHRKSRNIEQASAHISINVSTETYDPQPENAAMKSKIVNNEDEESMVPTPWTEINPQFVYDKTATWSRRVLFLLNTVTVNCVVLWTMTIRLTVFLIGLQCFRVSIAEKGTGVFDSRAMNICDFTMGILISIPIVCSIVMEIYECCFTEFLRMSVGNALDFFVLVPSLILCILLQAFKFSGVGQEVHGISKVTVFVIWPVITIFLAWRIMRTVGSRVLLAPNYRPTHARTKSMDFIWVSRTQDDDSWLVEELLPVAESNMVRFHRFITRGTPKVENWALDYEEVPLKTTYKRPDWDNLFMSLVDSTRSGTVIGVFFCGPDSMADMVKQAALQAMARSQENARLRGFVPNQYMVGDSHIRSTSGQKNTKYGCAVGFAIRIENFN